MEKIVEFGTLSSRGQVAIPSAVRKRLNLNDGEKIIFVVEGDTLMIKKVNINKTWEEVTRPLRNSPKKIREDEVVKLIHKIRKAKKHEDNS
ncbi:MAG: AbrB/MazE/SpoVT family DNA-binding domain-containing protein [Nanoarchaeota archaeon]